MLMGKELVRAPNIYDVFVFAQSGNEWVFTFLCCLGIYTGGATRIRRITYNFRVTMTKDLKIERKSNMKGKNSGHVIEMTLKACQQALPKKPSSVKSVDSILAWQERSMATRLKLTSTM